MTTSHSSETTQGNPEDDGDKIDGKKLIFDGFLQPFKVFTGDKDNESG